MQIDVILPDGKIDSRHLDPHRGIANIGRHRANELVLDSPGVAQFHALLDYRQTPYRITPLDLAASVKLNGKTLTSGIQAPLGPADTIELGGCQLLVRGTAGQNSSEQGTAPSTPTRAIALAHNLQPPVPAANQSVPTPPAQPTSQAEPEWANEAIMEPDAYFLGTPLKQAEEPSTDDNINQNIGIKVIDNVRSQTVEVGESATWRLDIVNTGRNVGLFHPKLQVWHENSWQPLPADENKLVQIIPSEININEEKSQIVTIQISPPRHHQSWAGYRRLRLQVTSPTYRDSVATCGLTLRIKPYYDFRVEPVKPQTKTIPYRTQTFPFTIPLHNLSNTPAHFDITGNDVEQRCRVEFDEPGKPRRLGKRDFILPPGGSTEVTSFVTPKERRFLGNRSNKYDLTFAAGLHDRPQTAQSSKAALTHNPAWPYWALLIPILLLLVLIVGLTTPKIDDFRFDKQRVVLGEEARLLWSVSAFGGEIQIAPNGTTSTLPIFPVTAAQGEHIFAANELTQLYSEKKVPKLEYKITAQHWLARLPLVPDEFLWATQPVTPLLINPLTTTVISGWVSSFGVNPTTITSGESAQVAWAVNAPENQNISVELSDDSGPLSVELSGVLDRQLQTDTTYTLTIKGTSLGATPYRTTKTVTVRPAIPDGTVEQVEPRRVLIDQPVSIRWNLSNANTVTLVEKAGKVPAKPLEKSPSTYSFNQPGGYQLELHVLSKGTTSDPSPDVKVFPIGSVTVLHPAQILDFHVFPTEVVKGSPDAQNVEVSWRVDGDAPDIELTGLVDRPLNITEKVGKQKVVADVSKDLELVVSYKNVEGSEVRKGAQLTVVEPTPTSTPAPIPPPEINFDIVGVDQIKQGGDFQLEWTVSNNPDRIEIASPDYPTIVSTKSADNITLNNAKSTSFTLTAFRNGVAVATQTKLLKPLPPPTPTATPTATPTTAPTPRVVNFTVTGDTVRLDASDQDKASYTANIGKDITLSWQAENATEVSLEETKSGQTETFTGLSIAQSLPRRLTQNVTYRLIAAGSGAPDNYTIEIKVNTPPPPPPPKNIAVTVAASGTARVTWDYTGDPDLIVGFRVYRAEAGSVEFTRRADELSLKNTDTQWTDDRTPTCNKVYYVVGVYEDKSQDPPEKRETGASASFNTLPCSG